MRCCRILRGSSAAVPLQHSIRVQNQCCPGQIHVSGNMPKNTRIGHVFSVTETSPCSSCPKQKFDTIANRILLSQALPRNVFWTSLVQNSESELHSLLRIAYQSTGQKPRWSDLSSHFGLSLFQSHTQLHLEVLFLRNQLEIVARSSPKLRLRPADRFLIDMLTGLCDFRKEALLIGEPETVSRWHQQSFKRYKRWKSRHTGGRP